MFVKAKDGIKVRDPKTGKHIPDAGAEVPEANSYWQRRLAAGDVYLAEKEAAPAPKAEIDYDSIDESPKPTPAAKKKTGASKKE